MATTHSRAYTGFMENRSKPVLPILTDPSLLLPQRESSTNRASIQSFLSTDTDPSTPSPSTLISPTLSDSVDLSQTPKSFLMPFRPKPAPAPQAKPNVPPISPPTVPSLHHQIHYKSYEHGAPLSDIGEEETTPRSKTRSRTPSPSASSPILAPFQPRMSRRLDKRLSEMSNSSNVSGGSDLAWETFDTKAGMSDRLKADLAAMEDDGEYSKRISTGPIGDDEYSSQALSKRAEQILASAKKRLTNMEDNLSKARTSILTSPKSPTFGEHRQAGGLYRSISQGGDRRTRKTRPNNTPTKGGLATHLRNQSETSVPTEPARNLEVRSASAMDFGYGSARIDNVLYDRSTGTKSALSAVHEEDQWKDEIVRSQSQMSTRELRDQMIGLKSRIEDLRNGQHADQIKRNSFQNAHTPSPFTHAEEWYNQPPEPQLDETGWEKPEVIVQPPQEDDRELSREDPVKEEPLEERPLKEQPEQPKQPEQPEQRPKEDTLQAIRKVDRDQMSDSYIQDSHYEDAFSGRSDEVDEAVAASEEEQVFLNEVLEESLQGPGDEPVPDIPLNVEPERHEDRADAFDYQNFFLHSALGNYSQDRRTRREQSDEARMSYASTTSVETMRGTQGQANGVEDDGTFLDDEAPTEGQRPRKHHRTQSVESGSSADTFETATEGEKNDRHSGADSDTIPSEILNWGGSPSPGHNLVGAWPSPPATIPRSAGSRSNQAALASSESLTLPPSSSALPTPPTSSPLHNRPESPGDSGSETETETETSDSAPSPASPHPRGQPPNTEILISALITLANPDYQAPGQAGGFAEIDKDLVVNVLRSVGSVCEGIHSVAFAGDVAAAAYDRKVWRRRLDVARRVLEGEIEIEEEYNAVDILK